MFKRKAHCFFMIKYNVGHAGYGLVTRHSYGWHGWGFGDRSIDRDQSFHAARKKQLRVAGHQSWVVPVYHRQKEEVALLQVMLDSIDHLRAVVIADLRRNHTDRKSSLYLQRGRKKVGAIIPL